MRCYLNFKLNYYIIEKNKLSYLLIYDSGALLYFFPLLKRTNFFLFLNQLIAKPYLTKVNVLNRTILTKLFLQNFYLPVVKLQFRRKGGWISCRRRWPFSISIKLGRGHPLRFYFCNIALRRYKKYLKYHSLSILRPWGGSTSRDLSLIYKTNSFNMYTWRGLRPSRVLLLKRQGKDSQYGKLKGKIF